CGGAALAAGPLAGGALIALFGWRAIFLVNLPIGLVGLWLTMRIPRQEQRRDHPLDLWGQIARCLALAGLTASLIEGPVLGWTSPATLGLGLGGIAASAGFLAIEARRARPVLPLALFRSAAFSAGGFVALATTLVFFGALFVLSLYFQHGRH